MSKSKLNKLLDKPCSVEVCQQTKVEEKYHYYVVYSANGLINSCHISLNNKINTMQNINSISQYISNEFAHKLKVIILNYIELQGE